MRELFVLVTCDFEQISSGVVVWELRYDEGLQFSFLPILKPRAKFLDRELLHYLRVLEFVATDGIEYLNTRQIFLGNVHIQRSFTL